MKNTLIAATALLILTTAAFADNAATTTTTTTSTTTKVKSAALVCPVTGEKIASVKEAAGSSTYKGKTYYFCCAGCKPMFDKNPAKYVKPAK